MYKFTHLLMPGIHNRVEGQGCSIAGFFDGPNVIDRDGARSRIDIPKVEAFAESEDYDGLNEYIDSLCGA